MPAQHHTAWASASSVSAKLGARDLLACILSWSFPAPYTRRRNQCECKDVYIQIIQRWGSAEPTMRWTSVKEAQPVKTSQEMCVLPKWGKNIHHLSKLSKPQKLSDTTTDSDCPSPDTEEFALPNQLSDSWKRSVNTRPTLWRTQLLLYSSLFEWGECKGAVSPRAQQFRSNGFLAHQGRGGCGKDFILAAVWVIRRLLILLL